MLLTIAAVVIALVLVRREILDSAPEGAKPRYVNSWDRLAQGGTRIGSPRAPLQLIEFTDIQCPFCRVFHARYASIATANPGKISLVLLHFPLESHPLARSGAHAIECANHAGGLATFVETAFAFQDSLAMIGWTAIAHRAGLPDTAAFTKCLEARPADEKIIRTLRLGDSLKIRGTPTVLVNGWLFPSPPEDSVLLRALSQAEAGRPFRP